MAVGVTLEAIFHKEAKPDAVKDGMAQKEKHATP